MEQRFFDLLEKHIDHNFDLVRKDIQELRSVVEELKALRWKITGMASLASLIFVCIIEVGKIILRST